MIIRAFGVHKYHRNSIQLSAAIRGPQYSAHYINPTLETRFPAPLMDLAALFPQVGLPPGLLSRAVVQGCSLGAGPHEG